MDLFHFFFLNERLSKEVFIVNRFFVLSPATVPNTVSSYVCSGHISVHNRIKPIIPLPPEHVMDAVFNYVTLCFGKSFFRLVLVKVDRQLFSTSLIDEWLIDRES